MIEHDPKNLKRLLEALAASDPQVPPENLDELAFAFRDCRLETIRLRPGKLSEMQLHELLQMEYRLEMAQTGQGSWQAVPPRAKRTLDVLGNSGDTSRY